MVVTKQEKERSNVSSYFFEASSLYMSTAILLPFEVNISVSAFFSKLKHVYVCKGVKLLEFKK